jgi:hypothetical protein
MVRMRLGSDGRICDARGQGDGPMQSVADCAARTFRSTNDPLPAPDRGCADVNLPINFLPRPDDAGASSVP